MIACTVTHPVLDVACSWWSDHRGHHTGYRSGDFGAHSIVEWQVSDGETVAGSGVCPLCHLGHGVHSRWCTLE